MPQTRQRQRSQQKVLFFSDVFIPHGRISANIVCKQRNALLQVEIDHLHSQGTQPIYPTLKVPAFPNYHAAKSKLAKQTTAIPTGRERRHHDQPAVAFLPACVSERVCLSMCGRIAFLHAPIVSSADQLASLIENGSTDGNAAFFEAKARFRKSNG